MTGNTPEWKEQTLRVGGSDLTVVQGGTGQPMMVLHEELGDPGWLRWHTELSRNRTLMIPQHPGFGKSPQVKYPRPSLLLCAFHTGAGAHPN